MLTGAWSRWQLRQALAPITGLSLAQQPGWFQSALVLDWRGPQGWHGQAAGQLEHGMLRQHARLRLTLDNSAPSRDANLAGSLHCQGQLRPNLTHPVALNCQLSLPQAQLTLAPDRRGTAHALHVAGYTHGESWQWSLRAARLQLAFGEHEHSLQLQHLRAGGGLPGPNFLQDGASMSSSMALAIAHTVWQSATLDSYAQHLRAQVHWRTALQPEPSLQAAQTLAAYPVSQQLMTLFNRIRGKLECQARELGNRSLPFVQLHDVQLMNRFNLQAPGAAASGWLGWLQGTAWAASNFGPLRANWQPQPPEDLAPHAQHLHITVPSGLWRLLERHLAMPAAAQIQADNQQTAIGLVWPLAEQ